MKKFLKILGILVGIILLLVIGGYVYLNIAFPKSDPPMDIKVEVTEARIERGKYLAYNVAVCMDCHSGHDKSKFGNPVTPGTEGMGGEKFDEKMGFPGSVSIKNITPAALKDWSDGELIRAVTCGVTKDNKALFPIMPYPNYNQLSEEDLYSIIAYLRTLKPIENEIAETELNFPLNLIVKTMPLQNYKPKEPVDKSDVKAYGKYLVTIASCSECHTPSDKGEPLPGMEFAGGSEFGGLNGVVRAANITPDEETGIANWTKEYFISRFKFYDNDSAKNVPVSDQDFNTPMPWLNYSGMSEKDLGAIYDYLKTLKPVKNMVVKFTPAGNN